MADPICSRVVVSQNETDEPVETAINVLLFASVMHLAFLLL
jgi:hypothetical protein